MPVVDPAAAPRKPLDGKTWELFHHGADVGVRGRGPTKAAAFESVGTALTGVVTDPATVRAETPVDIRCEAPDDVTLLVDWLNALIYEMAVRRLLFSMFSVSIVEGRLSAVAAGEPVDRARHQPAAEPKGATYTLAAVRPDSEGGWIVECVVDV